MVQCLGRAGANPWLATSLCGKLTDPQLGDLIRKIKFWRKYCFFHPWDKGAFCSRLASTGKRTVGPAAILQAAFFAASWTCLERGSIGHYSGLTLNWMTNSEKHVHNLARCMDIPGFI